MPGFKRDVLEADHYVLGSGKMTEKFGAVSLMPDGHGWSTFVPPEEDQLRYGLETMDCTVFGTLKALITLAKRLGFTDWPANCSERYNGIMANTTRTGNSPHAVIENIRTLSGVILEAALPWTPDLNTWEKYYAPKPLPTSIIASGQLILKHFTIGHEWVFNGGNPDRPTLLKQALARGTVAASVYAWRQNPTTGLFYKLPSDEDEHWIQIVDYVEGQYWEISDQYAPYRKHLEWNYPFECAKWYALTQQSPVTNLDFQVILTLIAMNLKQLLQIILSKNASATLPAAPITPLITTPMPPLSNREKLYNTAVASIGRDMSPADIAPDSLACAESLNGVYAAAFGAPIASGAARVSTEALYAELRGDARFEAVTAPLAGDIVISPTGFSNKGSSHGHTGIWGNHDVMSNDSASGLWRDNYTHEAWYNVFHTSLGFPVFFFRVVG